MKCEIQSRVLAFGVLRSHSITILSSSSIGWPSGPRIAVVALRFLGFGWPPAPEAAESGADAPSSVSSAFRLPPSFAGGAPDDGTRGEEGPGLLPLPESASVPFGELTATCASGLPARRPFGITRGLGAFGLVARFATMECPLCPGFGEVARELGVDAAAGRDEPAGVA